MDTLRRNSCGCQQYPSFAAYLFMPTYLFAAAVRYSSSPLLPSCEGGLGKMAFHFLLLHSLREVWRSGVVLRTSKWYRSQVWCFPFFELSIRVNGYFSAPATKADWRSIFCLYFSRIFFTSIQCKAKWEIWESLIRMTQKIFIRMAKFIWSILLYSGTHLWGTSIRVTNIFDNLVNSRNDTGFKDNLHN